MSALYPMPGDAVVLAGKFSIVRPGSIGILEGVVGEKRDGYGITFNYSCFRGGSHRGSMPEYVSCSGGPATILTPADELVFTGKQIVIRCWQWKDYPRGGGGEPYEVTVPVFSWKGEAPYTEVDITKKSYGWRSSPEWKKANRGYEVRLSHPSSPSMNWRAFRTVGEFLSFLRANNLKAELPDPGNGFWVLFPDKYPTPEEIVSRLDDFDPERVASTSRA